MSISKKTLSSNETSRIRTSIGVSAAAALVAAVVLFVVSGGQPGGAATLTSADGYTSLTTIGTVTPDTPYTSGQHITVSTITNPVIDNANLPTANQGGDFYLLECADPGATSANLPTSVSGCETRTLVTAAKTTSGAFTKSMPVYDLPDSNLGQPTMTGSCDVDPNQCVVGIFVVNPGTDPTTAFTLPHLFSAPFNITVGDGNDMGDTPGDGSAPTTTTPLPTTLSTSLSGGGQSGASISVPTGTAVTDTAMLSGTNVASASGTVTYDVYSDSGCSTLAPGGGGSAETITTPGSLPASAPVTLSSAATYYWRATYSGDSNNQTSTSTCGAEVETVTAAVTTPLPTTLSTSLSGGGQSGASISVPTGTAVTDTAMLSGTNVASASGTVTYDVYSDSGCSTLAPGGGGSAETITTPGSLPASAPVTLSSAATYYWRATYSGDSNNQTSTSTCGAEVETVTAAVTTPLPTTLSTSLSGGGQSGASISVPTGTAVTDTAMLSGTNVASASGTVTYDVYSDSGCSTLAPGGGGSAETITTPGSLPASAPVTLSSAATYYWRATYSGDSNNQTSTSTCGAEVETVTAAVTTPLPTTLSTSLSGGGQSGASISVPTGTAVTDTAMLSGTNVASASGTVTYDVYSDSGCSTLAPGGGGSAETITTPGSLPASAPVTLSSAATYYWRATYSGDSNNQTSTSTCGAEVETVTAAVTTPLPTTLSTSLSGGGQSGASISVPTGTAVTDTAMLSGTNVASASGTVTYDVYSDSGCSTLAPGGGGSAETITTPGSLPASAPVTLSSAATYYWRATYSGDSNNQTSTSTCGAEVETVTAAVTTPLPTRLKTKLVGNGSRSGHQLPWESRIVTVFAGASVTDTARLSGTNVTEATGTVTYTVYTEQAVMKNGHRSWQWVAVANANAGTVTVTAGQVPNSNAVSLPDGVYEWQAVYSGDSANQSSSSRFDSETEIVVPLPQCEPGRTTFNHSCHDHEMGSDPSARGDL